MKAKALKSFHPVHTQTMISAQRADQSPQQYSLLALAQ